MLMFVFCCCCLQSDAISNLEKEHDFREEHFDFLQQWLRKFCLKCKTVLQTFSQTSMKYHHTSLNSCVFSRADGASLFYSSVKEEKNCELLQRYLLHRIYDFPFNTPAFVVERDAVFVWVTRTGSDVPVTSRVIVLLLLFAVRQGGTQTPRSVFCTKAWRTWSQMMLLRTSSWSRTQEK